MQYGSPVAKQAIGSLVDILDQRLYNRILVREYIWGQKHPLIKLGRDLEKDPKKRFPYDKYGLLVGRNYTNTGKATVATGLDGTGYLFKLLQWDDSDFLNIWKPGSECDKPRLVYRK